MLWENLRIVRREAGDFFLNFSGVSTKPGGAPRNNQKIPRGYKNIYKRIYILSSICRRRRHLYRKIVCF